MIQFSRLSVDLCVNWFVLGLIHRLGMQSCYVRVVRVRHQFHPVVVSGDGGVHPRVDVTTIAVHHGRGGVIGGMLRQRHGRTIRIYVLHWLGWVVRQSSRAGLDVSQILPVCEGRHPHVGSPSVRVLL